jgi:hypothetical protein
MKNPKKNLVLLIVAFICFIAFVCLQSCNDDDPKKETPLHGTWAIGSGYILKDGVDVTSKYPQLQVTFSADGTYTSTNAKPLFKNSGSWKFNTQNKDEIILDGDFTLSVTTLTATELNVTFVTDADHVHLNGRNSSVVGHYELQMERQ